MASPTRELSILFMDVVGSTSLYERLGDTAAHALVDRHLRHCLSEVTAQGGRCVKTMGDGFIATFAQPDAALQAATGMIGGGSVEVRVGVHHGSVLEVDGDIFGDAVNLTARILGLTGAGEILLTRQCQEQLAGSALATRVQPLATTRVRGKQSPVELFRFLREEQDSTVLVGPGQDLRPQRRYLSLAGGRLVIGEGHVVMLGRDAGCDLIVPDSSSSRRHAKLEFLPDGFTLTDQSTNGTHICDAEGRRHFLLRRSMVLTGSGLLWLGRSPDEAPEAAIPYREMIGPPED